MPIPLRVLRKEEIPSVYPTDFTEFIGLEQCYRYLRLKMTDRIKGVDVIRDSGLYPNYVTPIMSLAGREFENNVESELRKHFTRVENFNPRSVNPRQRSSNNEAIRKIIENLPIDEPLLLFQSQVEIQLKGWHLVGTVDLIKITKKANGACDVLIVDMKATNEVKTQNRLQVAFYYLMLEELFRIYGVGLDSLQIGILYRGPVSPHEKELKKIESHIDAASKEFHLSQYALEIINNKDDYLYHVESLLLENDSTIEKILKMEWESIPYTLSYKCSDCYFNEFCMKTSAESEDLSLLPYLKSSEKEALQKNGIKTIYQLAHLKDFVNDNSLELVPSPGNEDIVKKLATTWPLGGRLDELIHRAKAFRRIAKKEDIKSIPFIPNKGESSLPKVSAEINPNLIWIFIDAQYDPLEERLYLISSRIVANSKGQPVVHESIVHMTEDPPNSEEKEKQLLIDWSRDLLINVIHAADKANSGNRQAPIHIVFFDQKEQQHLIDALARNYSNLIEKTPPLYDFLTQTATFDSIIVTYLSEEIRAFQNFPQTCQTLQSIAGYLKFNWKREKNYPELFRARYFDSIGKTENNEWYTRRARFYSNIPLEYAYAAWDALPDPKDRDDEFKHFRHITREDFLSFQKVRLEALEHICNHLTNRNRIEKTPFLLPEITEFQAKARNLAEALLEFVQMERFVELSEWKQIHALQPEKRVLIGECLLVEYREEDQTVEVQQRNRHNQNQYAKRQEFERIYRLNNKCDDPTQKIELPKEQIVESNWSNEGLVLKLRLITKGIDADIDQILSTTEIQEDKTLILYPRWYQDQRKTEGDQPEKIQPSCNQLLYGQRARFIRFIPIERDPHSQKITSALIEVQLIKSIGNPSMVPYSFGSFYSAPPMIHEEIYTLDLCPNSIPSYQQATICKKIIEGKENTLYTYLHQLGQEKDHNGLDGQHRFLEGLKAFQQAGHLHDFEESKRQFIGQFGNTPILLVQGPPGTGKSYSTAFAIFSRIQAAMELDRSCRVFISCKTHAAVDVLLENIANVQNQLNQLRDLDSHLFDQFFDKRLLNIPLFRVSPKKMPPEYIISLFGLEAEDDNTNSTSSSPENTDIQTDSVSNQVNSPKKVGGPKKNSSPLKQVKDSSWCVVAATPSGINKLLSKPTDKRFKEYICDLLVLDEASQMNLPEALLAAISLNPKGQVIVVGDHRQMPPIIKHDWETESRRTFQEYQVYRSLFDTLRLHDHPPPMIQFAESFRLHEDIADFLKREIYIQDGINYHSNLKNTLPKYTHDDEFVHAVLQPVYPLVVVVHEETSSQVRNTYEQELIAPILITLTDQEKYNLEPREGLGVVVPHKAQRAALKQAFPQLSILDQITNTPKESAVDTVERFQGGERKVILVCATESDPSYLLTNAGFLLDARRLTVAMSRAKQKLILVASRSVFTVFSSDPETFRNAQIWKNLLKKTCTTQLWQGIRHGVKLTVWGGAAKTNPK